MAVVAPSIPYVKRPLGALWLWVLGIAAVLLATGIGVGMSAVPVPASQLLAGVGVNAALLAAAVTIGAFAAPRCGLTSLIVRAAPAPLDRRYDLMRFALVGLVLGALIAGVDAALFAFVPSLAELLQTKAEAVRTATAATPGVVIVRMAYGGIVEEILIRWCLLALLALGLKRIGVRRPLAIGIAIAASALLFGLLHLPSTFHLLGDPPAVMLLRVVVLNALLGGVYGIVASRSSLEAAMACHAATHLGLLFSGTAAL